MLVVSSVTPGCSPWARHFVVFLYAQQHSSSSDWKGLITSKFTLYAAIVELKQGSWDSGLFGKLPWETHWFTFLRSPAWQTASASSSSSLSPSTRDIRCSPWDQLLVRHGHYADLWQPSGSYLWHWGEEVMDICTLKLKTKKYVGVVRKLHLFHFHIACSRFQKIPWQSLDCKSAASLHHIWNFQDSR